MVCLFFPLVIFSDYNQRPPFEHLERPLDRIDDDWKHVETVRDNQVLKKKRRPESALKLCTSRTCRLPKALHLNLEIYKKNFQHENHRFAFLMNEKHKYLLKKKT